MHVAGSYRCVALCVFIFIPLALSVSFSFPGRACALYLRANLRNQTCENEASSSLSRSQSEARGACWESVQGQFIMTVHVLMG